ncbi:MAG: hypothetical protein R3F61_06195 [Myxococcota bacterium]
MSGNEESPEPGAPAPTDLFGAIVRLEVEGWKTGPGRADLAEGVPPDLGRLLKKCAWLESPSGVRHDLTGTLEGPDMSGRFTGRGVELRRVTGDPDTVAGLWMSVVNGQVRVWALEPDGQQGLRVSAIAASLEGWLAQLVAGTETSGVVDPLPLPDLLEVGDGVGWRLADLVPPVRLGRVPEEVAGEPFELDHELIWVGQRVLPLDDFMTDTVPVDDAALPGAAEPALDELFGQGGGRPRPRTALITSLLLSGVTLTVLGMACIAAPGGILVLLAWMYVETDQKRIESGYLPASDAVVVERTRRFTYAGLVLVVFLFAVQGFLLCNGAYDVLLDNVYIPMWHTFVRGLLDGGSASL